MIDLSGLNEQQQEAVVHVGTPLLVSAGAGSGKTRVITYKIAHLVYDLGVDPASVLAVTFTNKAANEMRERVHRLFGGASPPDHGAGSQVTRQLTVSTFHSYCARLLRRHSSLLGFPPSFTIADVPEQERILKDALARAKLSPQGTARKWLGMISRAKERGMTPRHVREEAGSWDSDTLASVYEAYQKALLEQKAMDFDDLLLFAVQLLRGHPDVLSRYRETLGHILIDEYQDTNFLQSELVRLLARDRGQGLCVVGDEDQSIYGWRGASIDHIRRFEKDFPGARVILLERNYRSTGHILVGASSLIRKNKNRYEKTLRASRPMGQPVVHFDGETGQDEVEFVVRELRRLIEEKTSPAAVLYRANYMSRAFEDGLVRSGLRYTIVGSLRFYERKEIKDLAAYLRLLANPRDAQAFVRAANVPPRRGLGPKTLESIVQHARDNDTDIVEAARRFTRSNRAGTVAAASIQDFLQVMDRVAGGAPPEARDDVSPESPLDPAAPPGVASVLRRVLEASRYEAALKEAEAAEEAEDRIGNVREFVEAAEEFDRDRRGTLVEFLDTISLTTAQDDLKDRAPIVLMTIHCAKGLEFPAVFVVNMNQNAFPTPYAYQKDDIEEERRLCYVAMTRAIDRLYLTSNADTGPSRFLYEIDSSCFVERGGGEDEAAGEEGPAPVSPPGRRSLKRADRVQHATFGQGTVLSVEGKGESAMATVRFDQHGVKRMVLKYAKLERA
ncbi:MAG: UvrD-helicase domain-containing protein [Acidobacteriota bacterium]